MDMKKLLFFVSIILLAAGCSKESGQQTVTESLEITGPTETRAHLVDGVNAAWDAGDKVSVFYNGGSNECWDYTGADGAFKGTISHEGTSYRVGSGRFVALYPYDSGATISSNVITTTVPATQTYRNSSYGWASMVSSTDDASLHFNYASAFVRVSLAGLGSVKSVAVRGNNNENIAGKMSVDISGAAPTASITASGTKTITVQNGSSVLENLGEEENDFWIGIAPGTFNSGLTVTVTLSNNSTEEFTVTGPVTVSPGEVLCVHGRLFGFLTISADFSSKTNFSPALPSSVVTSEGTHTFTSAGNTYSLTFHPMYDSSSYGYGFYNNSELLIGRKNSWIKLPVINGFALFEVEYVSGGTSGQPYLSASSSNPKAASNQVSSSEAGSVYSMTLSEVVANKQYYLIVGAGNLRIKSMTIRYIAIN